MNEENKNTQVPEQDEAFMNGTPTRAEVNQYLNNLFLAVNNSIGVFHATNTAAFAAVLANELSARGSAITAEDLMKMFTDESIKLVKDAQASMAEVAKNADAISNQPESATAKEVDISVF